MRRFKRSAFVCGVLCVLVTLLSAMPFLFLQAGFSQELWATYPTFMGGVAFAPDGDVWVNDCGGGVLRRFDAQTTVLVNGNLVHPQIATASTDIVCGMTNHPDGALYLNSFSGVVRHDASTGAFLAGPFGPGGDALGIAVHPLTNELVYVGGDGTLYAVDPAFTTSRTFSVVLAGFFVDGIFFDPSGQFLFTATRSGGFRVSIIRSSDGSLVQDVPLSSEPDGIAFHASSPKFVVTNNTDGTMSRLDFPGDDFTQAPVVSLFASGGFRGDLSQVGPDGCLYLTQAGTRFDNGTTISDNSVVRLCPGFSPAPGVSSISLSPLTAINPVGTSHTVTAHVEVDSTPVMGELVTFEVLSGPHAGLMGNDVTDAGGDASFTYVGAAIGIDTLQASFDADGTIQVSNSVTKEWVQAACETTNFETDDSGQPMAHGTRVDTEFDDGSPTITGSLTGSGANTAAILNSSTGPAAQDPDLLVGRGNILILQTDANTSECPPGSGIYCSHNDDEDGGTLSFAYDVPVTAMSIVLIDVDATDGTWSVVLVDATGAQRTYSVPASWTGDLVSDGPPGWRLLDLTLLAPQPGFASVASATQDQAFDPAAVVRIDVHVAGSGALDDLTVCSGNGNLPRAAVLPRNGSGVNRVPLTSASPPVLGSTWAAQLDCRKFGSGIATLSIRRQATSGLMTPLGEELIAGGLVNRATRVFTGAVSQVTWQIPPDTALMGISVYAQGSCQGFSGAAGRLLHVRGGLSNALDLTLGY